MKNDKIINGRLVRKNPDHPRVWDVMETRAGRATNRVLFTGSLRDIRVATRTLTRVRE